MQVTINGKQVVLRDKISGARGWRAMQTLMRLSRLSDETAIMDILGYDDAVALCSAVIETWEFEGEPSDAASYEALDVPLELIPLLSDVVLHLGARTDASKN